MSKQKNHYKKIIIFLLYFYVLISSSPEIIRCHVSLFSTLFRTKVAIPSSSLTPQQYLARNLKFTQLHISEVAHKRVFFVQAHLCRCFKSLMDQTPPEYRKKREIKAVLKIVSTPRLSNREKNLLLSSMRFPIDSSSLFMH